MDTSAIKMVNIATPKALSCWNKPFDQSSKIMTDAVRLLERANHRQRHQKIEPEKGGAEHDARQRTWRATVGLIDAPWGEARG
ncbi:MAG: hypothetical protein Q8O94_00065 [bacterium]|nr:hypothetical protein [bacterium]